METVQIRVPKETADRARILAAMQERQPAQVIDDALQRYIDEKFGSRAAALDEFAELARA
jgi:predicted transcriptional regulator